MPEPFLGSLDLPVDAASSPGLSRLRRPIGAALAETQRALIAQMAEAEQRIPGLLSEISTVTASADSLALYSRIQVLAAIHRSMLPGAAGFGLDALVEFYGGLVTALPEQDVLDRLGTEFKPFVLYELLGLLREYGRCVHLAHQSRMIGGGATDSLARVRHLLEFEHRFDRMMGYPTQLRQIFHAIVDPLAEKSIAKLGYALGDVLAAADAYLTVLVQRGDAGQQELGVADMVFPDDPEERVQLRLVVDASIATLAAAPLEDDLPGLLAERTGISRERLTAVLAALVTPLGSQPQLGTLGDTNRLRRRPIIGLPDGRYLWPRPGDFVHEALDWAAEVCQADAGLLMAFDKRRQDGCEELTRQALTDVFGGDYVHAGYTYPAPGRPDIDVLVATPGVTVVVEVKGGRFTDPARRGAPDRTRKKIGEFVDKALSQNARTITHLQAGASGLQDVKGRSATIPNAPNPTSVIVTLDRVDPFASDLPDGGKRSEEPAAGTWLVTLADLLMVTDILRHPAEFFAYAHTRAAINKVGSPRIYVETDALGTWCEHRIKPDSAELGEIQVLSTSSESMNGYYTHADPDVKRPARPGTEVPTEVLNALDDVLRARPEHWRSLALTALSVRPNDWQQVRRALAKHSPVATTRRERRRVLRAARGFTVGPGFIVHVTTEASPPSVNSTTLIVRPPVAAESGT